MIYVIGGSGFIGTRLCERFMKHQRLFGIFDKVESAYYPEKSEIGDIRSVEALRSVIPEGAVLINLAAEHRDDVRPKVLYDEVNVEGAINICQVAREREIQHIIFTSSVAVYGFAPAGTSEAGEINYFNDYGRTKWLAEGVFKKWQAEEPENRTLVIVRPTVVFGEQNRGNVYNLLHQMATGKFVMIGNGRNTKSMAYVENIAGFLEYALSFTPGVHIHNYIDKPDFEMNTLVGTVRSKLGKGTGIGLRLPYRIGLATGYVFDVLAAITHRNFPVSSIRVKKFCATTQFATNIAETGFVPPVSLAEGLERTVQHEFLEDHVDKRMFFTE